MKRLLLVLTAALVALEPGTAASQTTDTPSPAAPGSGNQVETAYEPPLKPELVPIYEEFKKRRGLEELTEVMSTLKFPRKILVKTKQCGMPNAFYNDGVVTVCYEWIDFVQRLAKQPNLPDCVTPSDAVSGALVHTFFHEIAHALFDVLQTPLFGSEEAAADQLATFMILQFGKETSRSLITGSANLYFQLSTYDRNRTEITGFADAHGTGAQRFFNVLCIAYGGDPNNFRDFVDQRILPMGRASSCEREYTQVKSAYTRLIDQELLTKWQEANQAGQTVLAFEESIPDTIRTAASIDLNGQNFPIVAVSPESRTITVRAKTADLTNGMNLVQRLTFWYEDRLLKRFERPYQSSYAIIAAIDDYERKLDPLKRGPTGYPGLTGMVEKAEELRKVLETLGFEPDHIRTLYNENATAEKINASLTDFWTGGAFEGAGRVFFYFGGHGAGDQGNGYLVTYDFDPKRPTATSFLMSDFVSRHFPLIKAHHLLVAIDSCSAGLAIPGMRTLGDSASNWPTFMTLAQIRAAVDQPARNLIVAGTGPAPAVADAGGIFTQALIKGLQGEADMLNNRVVQFDQLALYVKRAVIARAAQWGVRQEPTALKATTFGNGEFLFQLPLR